MERITLHECRHTFASLMIAAGVNAKALSTYMGHSAVAVTFDRYGHLMPGNENEAARILDAYLARDLARTGGNTLNHAGVGGSWKTAGPRKRPRGFESHPRRLLKPSA